MPGVRRDHDAQAGLAIAMAKFWVHSVQNFVMKAAQFQQHIAARGAHAISASDRACLGALDLAKDEPGLPLGLGRLPCQLLRTGKAHRLYRLVMGRPPKSRCA